MEKIENKTIKTKKKNKVFCKQNIPNMLVILRMVLAVAVTVLILCDAYGVPNKTVYSLTDPFNKNAHTQISIGVLMLTAGCLFVLASITDWLDGFLARRNNWVSEFGKFWDPIADKVLVNSVLVCFVFHDLVPAPFVIIMIVRDIVVDAKRMTAARKNIVVAANIYGKMKTVTQMVGLIAIFFIFQCCDFANHKILYFAVQNLFIYLATIISVISGIIYFKQINAEIKKQESVKPDAK